LGADDVKNQYFGDINDYRKYGLLRALCADELSLAVCWMLTADDGSADGRRLEYLDEPNRYRPSDPTLFDFLHRTVRRDGVRDARRIESSGLLGDAVFHSRLLTDNRDQRREYFQTAMQCASGRDLLFFDPDMGLEVKSVKYGRQKSSMYLYWHELAAAREAGHSVLVYQHRRREKLPAMLASLSDGISQHCGGARAIPIETKYVPFILIPQDEHLPALQAGVQRFRARMDAEPGR
jgi:hypothetical protein